ncbi:MAG: hypothetical protein CME32_21150 [Gimesia sp.]|nr:hypothetical protein [Gimesia sp.]
MDCLVQAHLTLQDGTERDFVLLKYELNYLIRTKECYNGFKFQLKLIPSESYWPRKKGIWLLKYGPDNTLLVIKAGLGPTGIVNTESIRILFTSIPFILADNGITKDARSTSG